MIAGLVAFRQHLQNLARTKGILDLNKVQMLVEQMGSGDGATEGPVGPPHHLHNLLEVSLLHEHANTKKNHTHAPTSTFSPKAHLQLSDFILDKNIKSTQAPRLLCNPGRGSQLWLVYCLLFPLELRAVAKMNAAIVEICQTCP